MANKKEYEIIINGVTEATQNVETLGDALNRLNSTVETHSEGIKKSSSSIDELAKTEQKITQYNEEYNKALQTNKAVLADKNKAIKDELDLEKANITVQEGIQGSYREKQTLLTALGKVIKNTNAQTDEEKEKLNNLKSQYATLNQELKDFDASLGNHQRNVGDYGQATKNLKSELKELQAEMANMLDNGIQKTDPAFQELAAKAGKMQDAIKDAREEINRFASDTKKLDDVVNIAQSATAAFQLYSGAMNAFGIESKEATEAIQGLMGVMSIVQSLQTLSNTLQNGSATARLFSMAAKALKLDLVAADAAAIATTKSQEGLTVAQKAGTIATKTLSMAIKAIPLMFVIGLVTTLITHWEDLVGWFEKTFPATKKLGGAMNGLKAVFMGVGKAIVNWLINPLKTMADVMKKLFEGDLKGAVNAAMDGIKNQFVGTAKAFKEGFQEQIERGLDKIAAKDAETNNKLLNHQMKMLEAKKGNDAKYTKEYQALMEKKYENDKKMAKGNSEELQKIEWERQEYLANLEREHTEKVAKENEKRVKDGKKAAKEQEKAARDSMRASIEYAKKLQEINNNLFSKINDIVSKRFKETLSVQNSLLDSELSYLENYIDVVNHYIKSKGGDANETLRELRNEAENLYLTVEAVKNDKTDWSTFDALVSKYPEVSKTIVGVDKYGQKMLVTVDLMREKFATLAEQFNSMTFQGEFSPELAEGLVQQIDFVRDVYNTVEREGKEKIDELNKRFEEQQKKVAELQASGVATEKDINDAKLELRSIGNDLFVSEIELEGRLKDFYKNFSAMFIKYAEERQKTEIETNRKIIDNNISTYESIQANIDAKVDSIRGKIKSLNKMIITDPATKLFMPKTAKKVLERYRDLNKELYKELKKQLEMQEKEDEVYLASIKEKYGEDSKEFIKACDERLEKHRKTIKEMEKVAKKANINPETGEDKPEATGVKGFGEDLKNLLDPQIEWDEFWWNPDAPVWENIGEIYDKLDEAIFSPINDAFTMMLEFQIEEAQEALDKATEMHDKSVEKVQASKDRLNEINAEMKTANASQLEDLKSKQADEMLLLAQREGEEKRLAKEKERRQQELDKKEKQKKKQEMKMQLVEAIANVAMGVAKTMGSYPWPVNAVFAALTAAMGAIQISTIQKQLSKLEDGGLLKGRSHANGGMRIEGTNIEVEGGEYVINKKSTMKYLPLLEAINSEGKVNRIPSTNMMRYASGGQLNYTKIDDNMKQLDTNKVIQASIGEIDLKPVVSVVDINRSQKNLTQVRQMAGSSR